MKVGDEGGDEDDEGGWRRLAMKLGDGGRCCKLLTKVGDEDPRWNLWTKIIDDHL